MNPNFLSTDKAVVLYRHALSGHSHKVELFLSILDVPHRIVDVDLANGAHKGDDFLSLNVFGQVPVIDDNGTIVSDSNAILVYLATKYPVEHQWLPSSPLSQAKVQRWLSVAAGEIATGPAAARLVNVFGASIDHSVAINKAKHLLTVMDRHLNAQPYLATGFITIADIACYTYVAHAPEGDVNLDEYPNVRAWLSRIEAHSNFVAMQRTPRLSQAS